MSSKQKFGRKGEKMAVAELIRLGYDIIDKNYSVHHKGEIDIIARDGATICFIEVKTRHFKDGDKLPREAVNKDKRERLRKAAYAWRKRNNLNHILWRYDIVEVYLGKFFWQHKTNTLIRAFSE